MFLENVKRFKSHDGGQTFETIKGILEGLGYEIYAHPAPSEKKTQLGDILEKKVYPKYTISDKLWEGHQRRRKEQRLG